MALVYIVIVSLLLAPKARDPWEDTNRGNRSMASVATGRDGGNASVWTETGSQCIRTDRVNASFYASVRTEAWRGGGTTGSAGDTVSSAPTSRVKASVRTETGGGNGSVWKRRGGSPPPSGTDSGDFTPAEKVDYELLYTNLKAQFDLLISACIVIVTACVVVFGVVCVWWWLKGATRQIKDGSIRIIGKLHVTTSIEIGRGSNGTVVFEGNYNERAVAVKRLLHTHHKVAFKEINNLMLTDQHPNIVRLFGFEEDDNFIYIALERCKYSLAALIEASSHEEIEDPLRIASSDLWANGFPSAKMLKLMWEIVKGLAHLHELNIVHRDLKPHNVLIGTDGSAKLSDMGISKILEESSTRYATGSGSFGWRAPEQIMHGLEDKAVDLFTLGCTLFYCITRGGHPFGVERERDANILANTFDLSLVDSIPRARNLFELLLASESSKRPLIKEVLIHPLFWSADLRVSFIRDTSARIKDDPTLVAEVEKVAKTVFGTEWVTKLDPILIANLQTKTYNSMSVKDLLRLIRNMSVHYIELDSSLKGSLGSLPDQFNQYFESRFPMLFIEIYKVILIKCRNDDLFKKYFEHEFM